MKKSTRLTLKSQTVRLLTKAQAQDVKGGYRETYNPEGQDIRSNSTQSECM